MKKRFCDILDEIMNVISWVVPTSLINPEKVESRFLLKQIQPFQGCDSSSITIQVGTPCRGVQGGSWRVWKPGPDAAARRFYRCTAIRGAPTTAVQISAAAAAAAVVFLLFGFGLPAARADDELAQRFPHLIQFELGASGFLPGDHITIREVHGDREHIEPGGSYLVEGSYTLASGDNADLALFCTTSGKSGPTPIQDSQRLRIVKGAGEFRLYETNMADGWLHVSFYPPHSSSQGGVYFGEKGNENTILRKANWLSKLGEKSPATKSDSGSALDNEANRALLAYLGNPVPPPADMDSRYNKDNLRKAFTAVCQKANLVITKLAVDDSEFPFLVYGTFAGDHTLPKATAFEEQKGYARAGSVRGSFGGGSSYFAVNMVPDNQFPADQEPACHRRLMLRLQMLADKAQQIQ